MIARLFPDLSVRRRQPEIMDRPELDPRLHRAALRGLARVNAVSGTVRRLWAALRAPGRPRAKRVLDLACGGGDVAVGLARRAARAGARLEVHGCDVSPTALDRARQLAARHGVTVRFFRADALAPLPEGYDTLYCSLFLHHLDDDAAVRLLAGMGRVARSVLISDLVRSPIGYLLAYVGCRLLSGSPIVRSDGPVSVAAAFTPAEALALAGRAGLDGARLTTHWPQRFLLEWQAA